ncbi:hypothetical protein FNV43_RR11075 [Rhamnella rubrinervis]|uniref:Uncharacterized protein n=1 Tax=Rhamnella rubrinervis TaxID=2594499 RepID=A0A8K0MHI6_9ROSA|nr:hypothetical protein FNV43_RR11075 [Rhamnella rubrinervis]
MIVASPKSGSRGLVHPKCATPELSDKDEEEGSDAMEIFLGDDKLNDEIEALEKSPPLANQQISSGQDLVTNSYPNQPDDEDSFVEAMRLVHFEEAGPSQTSKATHISRQD